MRSIQLLQNSMFESNLLRLIDVISECFFNQPVSDCLQHFALIFEVTAIWLVWRDYKIFRADVARTGRAASLTRMPGPRISRRPALAGAFTIGSIAILMEIYQLATQYLGC